MKVAKLGFSVTAEPVRRRRRRWRRRRRRTKDQ